MPSAGRSTSSGTAAEGVGYPSISSAEGTTMPCMRKTLLLIVLLFLTPHHRASYAQADPAGLVQQVRGAERAFAKTMADRDHVAFGSFLDMDAVFMSDDQSLRGKAAVADGWKRFFEGRE